MTKLSLVLSLSENSSKEELELLRQRLRGSSDSIEVLLVGNDRAICDYSSLYEAAKNAEGDFISFGTPDQIYLEDFQKVLLDILTVCHLSTISFPTVEVSGHDSRSFRHLPFTDKVLNIRSAIPKKSIASFLPLRSSEYLSILPLPFKSVVSRELVLEVVPKNIDSFQISDHWQFCLGILERVHTIDYLDRPLKALRDSFHDLCWGELAGADEHKLSEKFEYDCMLIDQLVKRAEKGSYPSLAIERYLRDSVEYTKCLSAETEWSEAILQKLGPVIEHYEFPYEKWSRRAPQDVNTLSSDWRVITGDVTSNSDIISSRLAASLVSEEIDTDTYKKLYRDASVIDLRQEQEKWANREVAESAFSVRNFDSYSDYVDLQRSKLDTQLESGGSAWLTEYDQTYPAILKERLENLAILKRGMNVLCLAARIGSEVKAFLELGCFAIGIDLNPGEENKYVVTGDFHDLQFPDSSCDVVFSNSLDHALELDKILKEVTRILKPSGLFIVEANKGTREGRSGGTYESFQWAKVDDLVTAFASCNLTLDKRTEISFPWSGDQLVFRYEPTQQKIASAGNAL